MPKSIKISRKRSRSKISSSPERSTIKGKCKTGYIQRKGYSYRKRSGKKVSVKRSCILERGRPGPGRGGSVKKRVIKIKHKGSLVELGYNLSKSYKDRQPSLKKIFKKYGYSSSIKKLNALAVLYKNSLPKLYSKVEKDMDYIRKISM